MSGMRVDPGALRGLADSADGLAGELAALDSITVEAGAVTHFWVKKLSPTSNCPRSLPGSARFGRLCDGPEASFHPSFPL